MTGDGNQVPSTVDCVKSSLSCRNALSGDGNEVLSKVDCVKSSLGCRPAPNGDGNIHRLARAHIGTAPSRDIPEQHPSKMSPIVNAVFAGEFAHESCRIERSPNLDRDSNFQKDPAERIDAAQDSPDQRFSEQSCAAHEESPIHSDHSEQHIPEQNLVEQSCDEQLPYDKLFPPLSAVLGTDPEGTVNDALRDAAVKMITARRDDEDAAADASLENQASAGSRQPPERNPGMTEEMALVAANALGFESAYKNLRARPEAQRHRAQVLLLALVKTNGLVHPARAALESLSV